MQENFSAGNDFMRFPQITGEKVPVTWNLNVNSLKLLLCLPGRKCSKLGTSPLKTFFSLRKYENFQLIKFAYKYHLWHFSNINNIVYCGYTINSRFRSSQSCIRQYTRSLIRFAHSPARSLCSHRLSLILLLGYASPFSFPPYKFTKI